MAVSRYPLAGLMRISMVLDDPDTPSPLDEPFGGIDMDADLSELELGIVTSLQTLREVLKRLSIGGRRWWIASDPLGAVEDGYSAPERWLYR